MEGDRARYWAIRAYALTMGAAGTAAAVLTLKAPGPPPVPTGAGLAFTLAALALLVGTARLPVDFGGARVVTGGVALVPVLAVGGPEMLLLAALTMVLVITPLRRERPGTALIYLSFNAGTALLAASAASAAWTRLAPPPGADGAAWAAVAAAGLLFWGVHTALLLVMLRLSRSVLGWRDLLRSSDAAVNALSIPLAMVAAPAVRDAGAAGAAASALLVAAAALALWRVARLEDALRRHELLRQSAERLTKGAGSLRETAEVSAEAVQAVLGADAVLVGILDPEGGLRIVAARGAPGQAGSMTVEGSVRRALEERALATVEPDEDDPVTAALGRKRLVAPLIADGEAIGILAAGDSAGVSPHWSARALGMAELLAGTAAGALARAKRMEELGTLAETDAMTGLGNLRAFRAALDRAIRSGRAALLFCDVDRFKEVNDTWGHDAGDAVLKGVADALRAALRKDDLAFRYAGDEFAAVLPFAGRAEGEAAAERIEAEFRELRFQFGPTVYVPSVSVGVAAVPEDGSDERALLAAADRDMYRRKEEHHRLADGGGAAG